MRILGRRRRSRDVVRVPDLLSQLREEEAKGTLDDAGQAQLTGLTEPPGSPARFVTGEGETVQGHAHYLLGRLLAFLDRVGTPITSEFLVPPATVYCVALAEGAARRGGDLRDPRLPIHTYAMVRVERALDGRLPVADEEVLLGWLVSELRMRPVADGARLLGERRGRRHAKLFTASVPDDAL